MEYNDWVSWAIFYTYVVVFVCTGYSYVQIHFERLHSSSIVKRLLFNYLQLQGTTSALLGLIAGRLLLHSSRRLWVCTD